MLSGIISAACFGSVLAIAIVPNRKCTNDYFDGVDRIDLADADADADAFVAH